MAKSYDDLKNSFGRCLTQSDFFERFCKKFMASHPDVRSMLEDADIGAQRNALRRGISAAIWHASGNPLSQQLIEDAAASHSRDGRAPVPPHLYPYWVESLVQTVGELDPKATPRLLERWRKAMGGVTDTFVKRY